MAIRADFGFIDMWDEGGIKRLLFCFVFSLACGTNKELLDFLDNQECMCTCTHVFRQSDMSVGV